MTRDVRGWESAVVVRVPALDQTIASLRKRFDLPLKPNGIAPHITAVVPFLPQAELSEDRALPALRDVCSECEPFDVSFAHTARFPRVLYLAPEPAEPFIALTRALIARWPTIKPYGGEHRQIVPHLTVATSRPTSVFDLVDEALTPMLPLRSHVDGAQLYFFDGRRWSERASLAFTDG
jgi:2'-5' RNA ligase